MPRKRCIRSALSSWSSRITCSHSLLKSTYASNMMRPRMVWPVTFRQTQRTNQNMYDKNSNASMNRSSECAKKNTTKSGTKATLTNTYDNTIHITPSVVASCALSCEDGLRATCSVNTLLGFRRFRDDVARSRNSREDLFVGLGLGSI